jgi:hypothetical protein
MLGQIPAPIRARDSSPKSARNGDQYTHHEARITALPPSNKVGCDEEHRPDRWIPLFEAPVYFPLDRRGRHPHKSCIYRWCKYGKHGVRLESWLVGRCRCTSPQAIARFIERLSKAVNLDAIPSLDGHTEASAALERLNNSVFRRRARGAKE